MTGPASAGARRRSESRSLASGEALRRLADRIGILSEYVDQTGREKRATSDETRVAILAALGIDAATDAKAAAALAVQRRLERGEVLPPVRVVEHADPSIRAVAVRVPPRVHSGRWQLEFTAENGEGQTIEGSWVGTNMLQILLPVVPALGYHELSLVLSAGEREWRAEQTLIVVPSRCATPDELLGDARVFGIVGNLYTFRSARNWGIGDIADLAALAAWTASAGGDFVGINPLHALLNRGDDVSPYSPISRLFRNPAYLDIVAVPELRLTPDLAERVASPELQAELKALRDSDSVRYEQVAAVKGLALDALHRVFADQVRGGGSERARAHDAFLRARGPALRAFATWMAIAEEQRRVSSSGGRANKSDWRLWPDELRDPDSPAVSSFAAAHAERIDHHCWVQFEIDRQLGIAATSARDAGMRIGLYQDLAIGSSPAGADAWAYSSLFVRGIDVGAPPDPYSSTGQNWGFPPMSPLAMRRDRYRYFRELLRTGFRHGGALRIDHILGFFRQFWIPADRTGADGAGAYVRYPSRDLLGILALESVRHGALVVGEDLGTIPPEVPRALERWGVLSSKVMLFERERGVGFKPPSKYPELALATVNTHDMAPITGYWQKRDLALRVELGVMGSGDDAESMTVARQAELDALLRALARAKILPNPRQPPTIAAVRAAVHAFICRTPSRLVGLALDDLAGETEPVNVPGVGADQYACWTRKMRTPLEVIFTSPEVRAAMRCEGRGHAAAPAQSGS